MIFRLLDMKDEAKKYWGSVGNPKSCFLFPWLDQQEKIHITYFFFKPYNILRANTFY